MISSLSIENVALIERGEINFSQGFVVLTGETGAGKSIIIDSIGLILGTRASRDIIRSGADYAEVRAIFEKFNTMELRELAEMEIAPEDGQLMLSRRVYSDGRSIAKISGRTVTVSMLRDVASKLVNIHGQHEGQLLTDSARHTVLLDLYAENDDIRAAYKEAYTRAKTVQKEILDVSAREKERAEKEAYLKYVIEEIEKVSPKPKELEKLSLKKNALEQSKAYSESVMAATSLLGGNGEDTGAVERVKGALSAIEKVKQLITGGEELYERLSQISLELDDSYNEIAHLSVGLDGEGETDIDKIEERMYAIEKLCRKYGGDEDGVNEALSNAKAELAELCGLSSRLESLSVEYASAKAELAQRASELSLSRKKAGDELCLKVREALEFLDMPGVVLFAHAEQITNSKGSVFYSPDGTEKIEFLISANVGEEPKPLSKIASGGELSRIVLAIKSVLNEKEGTGTLIFDEVDTGVSGKTSYKVGVKLLSASRSAQVFCVTHSAQIASLADTHLKVSKSASGGRSYTQISELTKEQRVLEIARIMGGDIISKTFTDGARELISNAGILKSQM